MDLSSIFEYGVGVAGICGMILIVRIFMKFIGNHIGHSTRAFEQLSASVNQIIRLLEKKLGG